MSNADRWRTGDILRGRPGSDAVHPIVYISDYDRDCFIGAMITHAGGHIYPDNIPMERHHFIEQNGAGRRFDIQYGPSYLVNARLLKKREWAPFRKVGQLTTIGISFVESYIQDSTPQLWEEYLGQ